MLTVISPSKGLCSLNSVKFKPRSSSLFWSYSSLVHWAWKENLVHKMYCALLNVCKWNTMKSCRKKRVAFRVKSHQSYLLTFSEKNVSIFCFIKKFLVLIWPHYPLLTNNLIILNLILIGTFAFFIAGYSLPEYQFFGKKRFYCKIL